jgi:glutathione S-transferase
MSIPTLPRDFYCLLPLTQYKLIGMAQSPWTLKAVWALDVCGVPYTFEHYVPTLQEPALRLRTRTWRGPVSVPVLLGPEGPVWGASEIATFANGLGTARTGTAPLGDLLACAPWSALSDAALAEGRAHVTRAYLRDLDAQEELVPPFFPPVLRKRLRFLVRDALRRIDRKYGHLVTAGALLDALAKTRAQLAASGGEFLLGQFSYADVALASMLEVVSPLRARRVPRGERCRQLYSSPELAAEYSDLLSWRARLIAKTRPAFLLG